MKRLQLTVNLKKIIVQAWGGLKRAWIFCYRQAASYVVSPVERSVFVRPANPSCHGQAYIAANAVYRWGLRRTMFVGLACKTLHHSAVQLAR